MFTLKHLFFAAVILITVLSIPGGRMSQTQTSNLGFNEIAEQENIKHLVESYFENRYYSISTLKLAGFDGLLKKYPKLLQLFRQCETSHIPLFCIKSKTVGKSFPIPTMIIYGV